MIGMMVYSQEMAEELGSVAASVLFTAISTEYTQIRSTELMLDLPYISSTYGLNRDEIKDGFKRIENAGYITVIALAPNKAKIKLHDK